MIAIRKVIVSRQHRKVAGGQSVQAEIEIVGGDVAPVLIDPTELPVFTLFNPSGVALVTDQAMIQISKGKYKTEAYQTLANSTVGYYTANFTVTHLDEAARLERVGLFSVIRTSTFATFSYLAIQDQEGVVWYWYVDTDNTLNAPNPAVPSSLAKQAVSVTSSVVPRWLEIQNPTPATRYVYPDLDGTALVSATQPPVGSGQVGSPTFIGLSGGSFQISLNISNEILLATV